jgi:hypothetical protein
MKDKGEMIGWMKKAQMVDFLLTISFSLFGMLLIFGLGFVFPTVNPYVVIKWIIIVCTVVFAYATLMYVARMFKIWKMKKGFRSAKK